MKKNLIILSLMVILTAAFYSFKSGEKESSNVALVMAVDGKRANEGYLVLYGDGTSEIVPFEIKYGSGQNALLNIEATSKIMNKLHDKDYRYVGVNVTPNSTPGRSFTYMIFEKK